MCCKLDFVAANQSLVWSCNWKRTLTAAKRTVCGCKMSERRPMINIDSSLCPSPLRSVPGMHHKRCPIFNSWHMAYAWREMPESQRLAHHNLNSWHTRTSMASTQRNAVITRNAKTSVAVTRHNAWPHEKCQNLSGCHTTQLMHGLTRNGRTTATVTRHN